MKYNKVLAGILSVVFTLIFTATVFAKLSARDIANLRARLEARSATFTVGPNSATERNLNELCGLVPPENWQVKAPFREIKPRLALPASWNWCDLGGCAPIKDQGACGSCWAFGTVGALESNIAIKDGTQEDLSEQYLVSCNTEGWGCDGGWWAHDYHEWKYSPPETEAGAVPENEFPYVAYDAPCGGPHAHLWKINDWAYIGNSYSSPSVDAIKQAIMEYGPVAAAVHVGDFFRAYIGGVFNINEPGDVNHGIVLVGWDDNQGANGVWLLRNSWGSDWGEDGYMRIEYGISQVGYAANYVVYISTTVMPDLVVSSIETDPTHPEPGELVNVYVVVENQGPGDAGEFTIDWYADLASAPSPSKVGDRREYVASLDSEAVHTMSATYSYSDSGSNHMAAQADTNQEVTESNEGNNVLWPIPLLVGVCQCDLNHDGSCDGLDWFLFIEDWGSTNCNDPEVECECDLNHDGSCDGLDWFLFIQDWGRIDCP